MAKIEELYFKAGLQKALRDHLGTQLRRVFRYSPLKKLAKHLYKECAVCGAKGQLEFDHSEPVAPVDREVNALEYFLRMFCMDETGRIYVDNIVALCPKHHKLKSAAEVKLRALHKTGPYSAEAKAKRKATQAKTAKRNFKIRTGKAKKNVSARRKKTKK
jgi:5-methylcytosine-specific restriction endonuclease McrA